MTTLPPADDPNPSDVDNLVPPVEDEVPGPPDEPVPTTIDPATRQQVEAPPVAAPVQRRNPSDLTETQQPENAPTLTENVWVCVEPEGPRRHTAGEVHPAFRSDSHRRGQPLECPVCGGQSIRQATEAEAATLV